MGAALLLLYDSESHSDEELTRLSPFPAGNPKEKGVTSHYPVKPHSLPREAFPVAQASTMPTFSSACWHSST